MVGIIDIGSNTIRLVMYDKGNKISNTAVTSEILHDTVDGNLTNEGTQKLCEVIDYLKNEAGDNPVYAFATFAFRVLENSEEVKQTVFQKTGVNIDVLSGKDEAIYDYYALKNELKNLENGVGVDLGGGSAQIVAINNNSLSFFDSFPIGAKKIKKIFVNDVFPTNEEENNLREYIRKYLRKCDVKSDKLYMMGGTAKTALRMYRYIKGTQNISYIETETLSSIIDFIKEAPDEIIKNVLRSRYDNIVCGIIAIEEIANYIGAKKIYVLSGGVREGYLIKNEMI